VQPYAVAVAGERDGLLIVDDGGEQARTIARSQFLLAWSRHRKGRHLRFVVDPPTADMEHAQLTAAVHAAVSTTVAHLTGPVLGHSFDSNFGFSGMRRLAEQLRDTRTKTGWLRRFGSAETFSAGVGRLHECLERTYTAPAATRPLYAAFLDESAAALGERRLAEAATLFGASGDLWSAIADRAAEAIDEGSCAAPADLFSALADLVEKARSVEEQAVDALRGPS